MAEVKLTITSIFMVPTLKIKSDDLEEHGFVNAYIRDKNRPDDEDNMVYLLFKPSDKVFFKIFVESEYDRTDALIEDYDYDGGYVVLVYVLDPRFEADFNLVRQGKYSKTSPEFQNLFPKVKKIKKNGKQRDEISLQHRVFRKDEHLKEYWEQKTNTSFSDNMELWSTFELEKETLDITKFQELV